MVQPDRAGEPQVAPGPLQRRRTRPSLGEMMLLVAGVGVGLAMLMPEIRDNDPKPSEWVLLLGGAVLGGVALVGVPLLLWERVRGDCRRFGAGRLLWFAHGTAAWLLWPPIVVGRRSAARGQNPPIVDPAVPEICYYYGTPLMAVYVTTSLLAGGWLRRGSRRGRRRPASRSWRERFGLVLGMIWAALGLYVLSMIYRNSFR